MRWAGGTLLALLFLLQAPLFAYQGQGAESIPSFVKDPQSLEKWFSSSFHYQMKIPDAPQTLEETLAAKAGDCDDLAALASAALFKMGISNDVLLIKTRGMNIRHAICLWRDRDGTYNFFSNQQLIRTHEKNMEDAVKKYFRSCEKVTTLPTPSKA